MSNKNLSVLTEAQILNQMLDEIEKESIDPKFVNDFDDPKLVQVVSSQDKKSSVIMDPDLIADEDSLDTSINTELTDLEKLLEVPSTDLIDELSSEPLESLTEVTLTVIPEDQPSLPEPVGCTLISKIRKMSDLATSKANISKPKKSHVAKGRHVVNLHGFDFTLTKDANSVITEEEVQTLRLLGAEVKVD